MSILRKLRRWCPQPKTRVPTNLAKLSTPIFAGALLAEILILLIAPMAYCALLLPKNIVVAPDQTLPLTNSQIKAAWPNLPTAQEIVNRSYGNSSYGYGLIDSSMPTFDQVKNYTWISPVNAIPHTYPSGMFVTRLVPVEFNIWLQLNDTTWVSPDSSYLAATTNNPPYSLPSSLYINEKGGFLGTGLPTEYVIIAVIAIVATSAAGTTYLRLNKRKAYA
jgi:hypothetical protein